MKNHEGNDVEIGEDHTWVEALSNEKEAERRMVSRMSHNEKKNGCWKRRTSCEKWLSVIVLGALVAIVVLAVKLTNLQNVKEEHLTPAETDTSKHQLQKENLQQKDEKEEICLTPHCVMTASRVLRSVDLSVDPCDNFYDFACGGWIKTHEVPSDRSNLYAYGVLRDDVTRTLRSLLEEEISEDDITSIRDAKNMYKSCIDEDEIEMRNLSVIYTLLQEFGGWPMLEDTQGGQWNESEFDFTELLLALLKYNNMPLLPLWVGLDDKNNTRRIIFIDQAWFGMTDRSFYLDKQYSDKLQAYKTLMINTAVYLGADPDSALRDANELIEFETQLANITMRPEDRRDNEALYNKMTIRELQDNLTSPYGSSRFGFEWLEYIQGAMKIPDTPINITEDEEVVVNSIPYYTQLFSFLNKYSNRTIANYIVWRIMRNRITNLPKRFRDELEVYYQVIYGTSSSSDRWKSCVRYLKSAYDMVLGRMFVEETFNNKSKIESLDMIENIRTSFFETLEEIEWMDDDMKAFAREKAENIAEVVGYPEFLFDDDELNKMFRNLTMNSSLYFENVLQILQRDSKESLGYLRTLNVGGRTKWATSPITVNAFYSFQRNQITFPAGILQPPYFHINQPRSMNYGGIGFLMGHEITHGFDDSGRQYDKDGNLYNWWTEEAETKFHERAQCLVDQYGSFVSPEAGLNVNGKITLGENIADNGAVKQTFRAYRNWVKRQGKEEPNLPGVNFTHNQLYFLNLAQIRCGISRKDDAVNHILSGPHSPNRFRITGSLQNMKEFSEAFQCQNGSYMNPPNKCSVW